MVDQCVRVSSKAEGVAHASFHGDGLGMDGETWTKPWIPLKMLSLFSRSESPEVVVAESSDTSIKEMCMNPITLLTQLLVPLLRRGLC